MNHYDHELKMYADSGLRTAEDWALRGRAVQSGSDPRVGAVHRGKPISLYGRDQTTIVHGGRDRSPTSEAEPPSDVNQRV